MRARGSLSFLQPIFYFSIFLSVSLGLTVCSASRLSIRTRKVLVTGTHDRPYQLSRGLLFGARMSCNGGIKSHPVDGPSLSVNAGSMYQTHLTIIQSSLIASSEVEWTRVLDE